MVSSRITLVFDRVSPTLVTYTAGLSCTGQTFSQAPQPMQSDGSTCGRWTWTSSIFGSPPFSEAMGRRLGTVASSTQIAFGDVGQNSSQTMHGVLIDQGRQRPRS